MSNVKERLFAAALAAISIVWCAALALAGEARERPELRYGAPSQDFVLHQGFIAGRAGKFTPWVLQHFAPGAPSRRPSREGLHFVIDRAQPREFRFSERDYLHSGFDKGHLPDAESFASQSALAESFVLTALTPQTPELNRGPWRMLEEHVRSLHEQHGAEAWVVSGPAFLPDDRGKLSIETLTPSGQWVGTHSFKVVLLRWPPDKLALRGWLLPNVHDPPRYEQAAMSIDEIESATGFDFFSRLDDELERKLEFER